MTQPIRLGDLLVRAGVVTDLDIQRALNEQQRWGGRLGTTLVRMGVLTEDLLVKALSKQLNIPRANLDAISLPAAFLARLDRTFCERNSLVPLAHDAAQGRLLVAIADPISNPAPGELGQALGVRVETYISGETDIHRAIKQLFAAGPAGAAPLNSMSTPLSTLTASQAVPSAATFSTPRTPAPVAGPDSASLKLQELNDLARKQTRALQAIVELLIERGVVTREEYLSWLQQR